jgi:hypothetical protein|tara:strand:- start:966 stop:1181 length:216 start_codon:yes stop_codon:yes gene_type:complete
LDLLRNSPQTDFADIVIVARLQGHGFDKMLSDVPEWDQIPEFAKLGLGPSKESLELEDYSDGIAIAADLLR